MHLLSGLLLSALKRAGIHRIKGTQAPDANNGQPVTDSLTLGPFDAIIRSAGPTKGELVVPAIDTALCRGCGLCATGCHSDAIVMDPL